MKQNNKFKRYYSIALALLFIYTATILLMPSAARLLQIISVLILLCAATVYDISQNQIPLLICVGILLVNIIYSVLVEWNYKKWLTAALTIFVLLVILVMNNKAIGLGDVLLLGFSVLALPFENILMFLFMTFLLSSVYGLIKGIKQKRFIGIMVPLAPCITLSFLIANIR